jgi:endothelin-converting enzyme
MLSKSKIHAMGFQVVGGLPSIWAHICKQHSSFSPAQLIQTLSSVDQQNFDKLKGAYDACMDEKTIKQAGIRPLAGILRQVAEMAKSEDSNALSDTVLFLHKLGVTSLLSLGASADDKDPDTVVVVASPPYQIGLPAKDYYSDDAVMKKYEAAVATGINLLHPTNYFSPITKF